MKSILSVFSCAFVDDSLRRIVKNNDYRSPIITLCLTLLASMTAFAQSEKVTLRMVPESNQIVRMRMIQDMEMEMIFEPEAASAEPLPEPIKIMSRTIFALTQKVGAQDKDGHIISELTYDEVSSEMTMNGQTMQFGDAASKFIGQKILATFNKQGDIIDIKIPPGLGLSEELFKQTLKSLYGDLPHRPIGVGEVATTPLDFTIPLPIPGAPPLKIDGRIDSKLVSVEKSATGRIAKFNQTVDGNFVAEIELPKPEGQIKLSIDFKMNGGGDLAFDIDKGVLKSSDSKSTFGGKIKMTGSPSEKKLPPMSMQGTMKSTITGSN